jgi:Zinc finger, C3HC4 type (RING finger)
MYSVSNFNNEGKSFLNNYPKRGIYSAPKSTSVPFYSLLLLQAQLRSDSSTHRTVSMSASIFSHFELDDKVDMCDLFFKQHFYNQFFRKRSFEMCYRLRPHADKLAEMGYFYSGREFPKQMNLTGRYTFQSYLFLTCVFCQYVHRVLSDDCTNFDFEDLRNCHERHGSVTLRCRAQFLNVPIRKDLAVQNVHEVEHANDGTIRMTELAIPPLLPLSEQIDPKNKWVICMICRERDIGVAFLPCGCAVMCSSCVQNYSSKECAKCNAEIKGYSKVIVT